jgi:hypothetical protein
MRGIRVDIRCGGPCPYLGFRRLHGNHPFVRNWELCERNDAINEENRISKGLVHTSLMDESRSFDG